MYFKRIVLANLSKSFSKDLLEIGTGGVGMNLRPLERSLTSSSERALFEKLLMYFSFCALMFRAKVFFEVVSSIRAFIISLNSVSFGTPGVRKTHH